MWSTYRAVVFSALARQARTRALDLHVYQIAETEVGRGLLSPVDASRHDYPMTCLFPGAYSDTPVWTRVGALARHALTTRADTVVLAGYDRPEYIIQAVLLWLRGIPRAVFCDSTAFDQQRTWRKTIVKRAVLRLFSSVFCYGRRSGDYMAGLGVARARLVTDCQAAALPLDYDASAIPAARIRAAPKGDHPLFLYVGRLSSEKQVDVLLTAFASVRAALPEARLRIVGGGPLEASLQSLAATLGCEASVEFTGGQSGQALYANYLEATALILPGRSEPWGLVVNEALHHGCPVIVSNRCGCVPELVEDSVCGLVVEAGDVAGLSAAMFQAATRWQDREAVAMACLARVGPFTPLGAARNIVDRIERLLQEKHVP
jgi:glycosyltransferase involved in cell wall biosynthesis